jgi:hypothetical protein
MIEAYAFLAAFSVQILVVSVLQPLWFAKYIRAKAAVQILGLNDETRERLLTLFRVANLGIAAFGLVLMVWVFNHMRDPGWDFGLMGLLPRHIILIQISPIVLVALVLNWGKKRALALAPPETKRTASLRRRGLFDIVSPFTVFLAILVYLLFDALVIFVQPHGTAGIQEYTPLIGGTLLYALNGFLVYWTMYRRKKWPLETPAYRLQAVEWSVKLLFHVSIAVMVFLAIVITLRTFDLMRWMPFAMSVYFVTVMLLTAVQMTMLRRQAEADRSSP